jgi:hypothetical protein
MISMQSQNFTVGTLETGVGQKCFLYSMLYLYSMKLVERGGVSMLLKCLTF